MSNKKLKLVVLKGDDHNGAFNGLLKDLQAIYTNSEYFFLGEEEWVEGRFNSGFTTHDITSKLQGRIDKDTTIIIAAHGGLGGSDRTNVFHTISTHRSDEYSLSTKSILSVLDALTIEPVHVILRSCYGGAALGDVKALKTGSTLRTFSDAKAPSNLYNSISLIKYLKENYNKKSSASPAQVFLENFQHYVSTTGFSVSLGKNKNPYMYTFKPFENCTLEEDTPYRILASRFFKDPLTKEADTLVRSCISDKEQDFVQTYRSSVDSNAIFNLFADQMSDQDQADSLGEYLEFIGFLRENYQTYALVDFVKDPKHKGIIKKLQSSNSIVKITNLEGMIELLKAGFKYDDPIFVHNNIKQSIREELYWHDEESFVESILSYLKHRTEEVVDLDTNNYPLYISYEKSFVETLCKSKSFINFTIEEVTISGNLSCLYRLVEINSSNHDVLINIAAEAVKHQSDDLLYKVSEYAKKLNSVKVFEYCVVQKTGIDLFSTYLYSSFSLMAQKSPELAQYLIKDEVAFKDILTKALKANVQSTFDLALLCGAFNNLGDENKQCFAPEITSLLNSLQTSDESQAELSGEQQNMDL